MMRFGSKFRGALVVAAAMMLGACSNNEVAYNVDNIEQEVLDAWAEDYNNNNNAYTLHRQEQGYYVMSDDSTPSAPASDILPTPGGWVEFNFTAYTLDGEVVNTRDMETARLLGTYNPYTRYVPYMGYILKDEEKAEYLNEAFEYLMLGYAKYTDPDSSNFGDPVDISEGSKISIIAPSYLVGAINGVGGFAGQNVAESNRPIRVDMEITKVISDREDYELGLVSKFMDDNPYITGNNYETPISSLYGEWTESDGKEHTDSNYSYVTEAQNLFYNTAYLPSETHPLDFSSVEYANTQQLKDLEYNTIEDINKEINKALIKRFGDDMRDIEGGDYFTYDEEDLVGKSNTATIWYITRTLDGFIVDSNISEVNKILYGAPKGTESSINYAADSDYGSYIGAWYHVIPNLYFGRWATFVTTSYNAYYVTGNDGGSTSTEIQANTPLVFEVYVMDNSEN